MQYNSGGFDVTAAVIVEPTLEPSDFFEVQVLAGPGERLRSGSLRDPNYRIKTLRDSNYRSGSLRDPPAWHLSGLATAKRCWWREVKFGSAERASARELDRRSDPLRCAPQDDLSSSEEDDSLSETLASPLVRLVLRARQLCAVCGSVSRVCRPGSSFTQRRKGAKGESSQRGAPCT
jgi:hypothetical protein